MDGNIWVTSRGQNGVIMLFWTLERERQPQLPIVAVAGALACLKTCTQRMAAGYFIFGRSAAARITSEQL
jgi:hypothetical protein